MLRKKYQINKGFTLAELLIVVAIIAVLVAISIPIFTSQLEKSREATDMANVRSAYAEVMDSFLDGNVVNSTVRVHNGEYSKVVNLKQREDGWTTTGDKEIGGVKESDSAHWFGNPHALGTCKVIYSEAYGTRLVWENNVVSSFLDASGNYNFTPNGVATNKVAYYTYPYEINSVQIKWLRSYYIEPGSYYWEYAEDFNKNPQPCNVFDSEFYKADPHTTRHSNDLDAFGFFTVKEDGKTIDKYTVVTEDAIYYSEDGGKTWIEK